MKHNFYEKDGIVIVELEGKIMGEPTDSSIVNKIYAYADQKKVKFIFDFTKVEWMNSRGLGLCISGATTLRNRDGDLKLACTSGKVMELLNKTKMFLVFDCYDSVDKAMAAFK
jgi:anti-sigma B factor antagonist